MAPWHSVYKIIPLTDTEVTFLLTSGGHNAGVVSPPGAAARSDQIATHPAGAPYVDPDSWQEQAAQHKGSWWPAWAAWLEQRAGAQKMPPGALRQHFYMHGVANQRRVSRPQRAK